MSKARSAAEEPSIESLLDSIRRAIHDETVAAAPDPLPPSRAPASLPATNRRSSATSPEPSASAEPVSLKRRSGPLPHLRESAAETSRRPPAAPSRPFIAPLAPQLQGSLRDLKVSVLPPTPSATATSARTEDLLALRSRIADLSATRERLARISAGGPSSFASVLGGYTRPDEAVARSGRKNGFEAHLPPPPSPGALRGSIADTAGVIAKASQPATARQDAPSAERALASPPQTDAFDEADEGYIESSLPDPGAADFAAEAWDADEDAAGEESGAASLPAVAGAEIATSRAILSQEVADATATAFDRLADTIVSQASGGARSIEDITRDLLRPMLKAWLDTNLQGVVERLVREEIDRVARRSGR
jgi:uncharacterized protein